MTVRENHLLDFAFADARVHVGDFIHDAGIAADVDEGVYVFNALPVAQHKIGVGAVDFIAGLNADDIHAAPSRLRKIWASPTSCSKWDDSSSGIFCVCSIARMPCGSRAV